MKYPIIQGPQSWLFYDGDPGLPGSQASIISLCIQRPNAQILAPENFHFPFQWTLPTHGSFTLSGLPYELLPGLLVLGVSSTWVPEGSS